MLEIHVDFFKYLFRTSHFGTFVLTQSLLPLLTKTAQEPKADVRIVYVRRLHLILGTRPNNNSDRWDLAPIICSEPRTKTSNLKRLKTSALISARTGSLFSLDTVGLDRTIYASPSEHAHPQVFRS